MFLFKRIEVIISILILGECAKAKIEYLNLLIDIAPSGIPRKKPGDDCYCICFYYRSIIFKMYHKLVPPYFYGSCNNSNQNFQKANNQIFITKKITVFGLLKYTSFVLVSFHTVSTEKKDF